MRICYKILDMYMLKSPTKAHMCAYVKTQLRKIEKISEIWCVLGTVAQTCKRQHFTREPCCHSGTNSINVYICICILTYKRTYLYILYVRLLMYRVIRALHTFPTDVSVTPCSVSLRARQTRQITTQYTSNTPASSPPHI